MGDKPDPKEVENNIKGLKQDAAARSWESAYGKTETAAASPEGRAALGSALSNDKSSTLPNLQLVWGEGKKRLEAFDTNKDGALSSTEIGEGSTSELASETDKLFLERLRKNFGQIAKGDTDPTTIGIEDLKKDVEKSESRQAAADLKATFPNQGAFDRFDHITDGGGKGRLTEQELTDNRKTLADKISKIDKTDPASLAEKETLMTRQRAMDFLSSNFAKIAGEGSTSISLDNINSFINQADSRAAQAFGPADGIHRTMTANGNRHFKELAKEEEVSPGKRELRISQQSLSAGIDSLQKQIDRNEGGTEKVASKKALQGVLKEMAKPEVFDAIAGANKDGEKGISLKDIENYQRLQSPALAQDLKSMFGTKLNEGISRDDLSARLVEERKQLAAETKTDADRQRRIATLETLLTDSNFDRLAHKGQPLVPTPPTPADSSETPPAPVPVNRFESLIDSQDLGVLKAEQSRPLELPKDVQGGTDRGDSRSTDASANSKEVAAAVNAMFKDVVPTKVDGRTPLIPNGQGLAIADYGPMQMGFHFTDGKVDAIYDYPKGSSPGVFQKDGETWFGRPNGPNISDGQYAIGGAADVDLKTGKFTRMISGKMGEDHQPEAGSSYQVWAGKQEGRNSVVSHYTMETDGSAYGLGYVNGSTKASRVDYLPQRAAGVKDDQSQPWQHLARQRDTKGQLTDNYFGRISTTGADGKTLTPNTPFMMSKPAFESDGTFSYDASTPAGDSFRATGHRAYHLPDGGLKWDKPIKERQKEDVLPTNSTDKPAKTTDIIDSVRSQFEKVEETVCDGKTPLKVNAEGYAIGDYGNTKVGYHFDVRTGNLDAVYNNPTGSYDKTKQDQPNVYERVTGKDGKDHWVSRPNGRGNSNGQIELPGALAVNKDNGKFTRMLSGIMDASQQPAAGSSYQVLEGGMEEGKRVISRYTMEKDDTAFGFSSFADNSSPFRIDYLPSKGSEWERLDQQKDSNGRPTNGYYGTITTAGADGKPRPNTQFWMGNPRMEQDGSFSYDQYTLANNAFYSSGKRLYHRPDGSLTSNQPVLENPRRVASRR